MSVSRVSMCVGTDELCTYELYTHTCSHEYTCIRTGAYDLEEQMRKEICEEEMPEGGAGVPLRGKSRARQVWYVCVYPCACACALQLPVYTTYMWGACLHVYLLVCLLSNYALLYIK